MAKHEATRSGESDDGPYNVFRREQQPLLLPGLKDREKQLGKLPLQL